MADLTRSWVGALGAATLSLLDRFGRFVVFSLATMRFSVVEVFSARGWRRILPQCYATGAMSVPVVMLTGLFCGMVLIVQGWPQFESAGLTDRLGAIVNSSVANELGPVLAGVMLAGRVGGALTAEIGTMNVTEQLLALRSMGAEPLRFLVAPRFLACLLLTPLLTLYADLLGAIGAFIVYVGIFQGDTEPYWRMAREGVEMWDIGAGVFKSMFFGGAIGLISCYKGFYCRAGAEGVGRACTQAFVGSFIVILILDFFLNIAINATYQVWFGLRTMF